MSSCAQLNREWLERFSQFWDSLFEVVPEARAEAVKAMGEAAKQELDAQIGAADLETDAKGTVRSWQELRLGSRGGYAALSPRSGTAAPRSGKQHTWKGAAVTQRQVTKWLERGHGTRKPRAGSATAWNQAGTAGIRRRSAVSYVKGRQFYSYTRGKALDLALKAADRALSRIADEVDY